MKALAKRLLDRAFGYFVSRFLQPELELVKSHHSRLAQEVRELARAQADRAEPASSRSADAAGAANTLRLDLPAESLPLEVGERVALTTTVENAGPSALNVSVAVEEPYGFGVLARPLTPMPFQLASGEQEEVNWEITAQRPSEVNLGHPWLLTFVLRRGFQECSRACLSVEVADREPGRIYYVLTEDCETFDGGELTGDYSALPELVEMHNRNNFMDPEEYRWQMVEKPTAMNRIADKYGAKWTHFWCTSQRFAADWAAGRSSTGQWPEVVALLDESVRRGCLRHEYAPHIHFGFEPDSALPPQPRLIYDPQTDGIIPNEFYHPESNPLHRYHGWDGGRKGFAYVKALGAFSDGDSKMGSLFKGCSFLARLQRGRRQPHSARAGACDFGVAPEDQHISTLAYLRNGLIAGADAGYHESIGAYPRGRQMYFCHPDDIEREISDLSQAGLVQFKAPDVNFETVALDQLTAWFERRRGDALLPDGSVAPGVHAIVQLTHAMVMKGGSGRMQDTEGGDFAKLDKHLEYVTTRRPEVQFGTMSEVALEFLDYYTPVLAAAVEPETERVEDDGRLLRFRIRLLGSTIPVSAERGHLVAVRPPAWLLPEHVESVQVLSDGREMAEQSALSSSSTSLRFQVSRRDAIYELVVHMRHPVGTASEEGACVEQADFPAHLAAGSASPSTESAEPIFDIPCPRVVEVHRAGAEPIPGDWASVLLPPGLLRLLMNPAAGASEPLGRGLHPLGVFPIAIAACAAAAACGDPEPLTPRAWRVEHVHARWCKPVTQESGMLGKAELVEVEQDRVRAHLETFDEVSGELLLSGTARLRRISGDARQT